MTSEPSSEIRWSIDSKWIYFGSNRGGRFEIWKTAAEGGPAVQVTRDGGYEAFSSPDGQYLFFLKAQVSALWKQPIGGGAETVVLDEVRNGRWGLAGDDLFWLTQAGADLFARNISVLHLSTGKREELYRFPEGVGPIGGNAFAVSSDARSFLINLLDRNDRDVKLVENFR